MKLKERQGPSTAAVIQRLKKSRKLNPIWLAGFALMLYSLFVFAAGLLSAENHLINSYSLISDAQQTASVVRNRFYGLFSPTDHLHIDIKHKHFQKLAYKRQVAQIMGRLISSGDDFVPAVIRKDDQSFQVKLRLKGDGIDHLDGEKWSYRVKAKGNTSLYGMRTFSIQHPKTRNYLAEWVYHQALKREDIISLRYDFINVSVNGKNLGIFAIEEHFDKILIEYNRRREGPIIRMSEDLVWELEEELFAFPQSFDLSSASSNAVYIDAFESKAIAADSTYNQLFLKAISLLEAFRNGEKLTREVFDIDKLATYLALTELMGAHHSAIWNHMRFYYNPVISRLEPIGFDGDAGLPLPVITATLDTSGLKKWRRNIFLHARKDPLFEEAYLKALYRVSVPSYLEQLYQEIQSEFDNKLHILFKEFPDYAFPFDILEHNRRFIHFTLNPKDGLRVHLKHRTKRLLTLELGSTQVLSTLPETLILSDSLSIPFEEQVVTPGRKENQGIDFINAQFLLPATYTVTDSSISHWQVVYKVPGSSFSRTANVLPYPHQEESYLQNDLTSQAENTSDFTFLIKDEKNKEIKAKLGNWRIDHNLVLPQGYQYIVSAGTTLDLVNEAVILARGPVMFSGSKAAPITVLSSDSTGQGLVVLKADSASSLIHTQFQNLSSVDQSGWVLTGGVTFYESEVSLKHTTFLDSNSEDALNIIRTSFEMDSVVFNHTKSDAFDGDFVEGSISNTTFEKSGNDAIDVSGSRLTIHNILIKNAGDKAFSAGEFSLVNGSHLKIYDSEIAVASKDQSAVSINNIMISESRVGVAVFQKKPEFGPASLESSAFTLQGVDVPALVEAGSLFMMNGERVPADQKNVVELLYGNLYGTKSN